MGSAHAGKCFLRYAINISALHVENIFTASGAALVGGSHKRQRPGGREPRPAGRRHDLPGDGTACGRPARPIGRRHALRARARSGCGSCPSFKVYEKAVLVRRRSAGLTGRDDGEELWLWTVPQRPIIRAMSRA